MSTCQVGFSLWLATFTSWMHCLANFHRQTSLTPSTLSCLAGFVRWGHISPNCQQRFRIKWTYNRTYFLSQPKAMMVRPRPGQCQTNIGDEGARILVRHFGNSHSYVYNHIDLACGRAPYWDTGTRISVQHWKNSHESRDGHLQIIRIALYVSTRTSTTLGFKKLGNRNAQAYWAWPCDATKLCGVEKHEDLCLDFLRMVLMHQRC